MSIESVSGGYSPDKIYGRLTSPFTPKSIQINAHTPYDEEETTSRAVTLNDFVGKNKRNMRVSIESEEVEEISYEKKEDTKVEFPPKMKTSTGNVNNFTASSSGSNDIVKGALQKGYSAEEAVVIARAKQAYSKSAGVTKNPIGALGSCSYRVN